MKIAILDDYQHAVRTLGCFGKLRGHEVTVLNEPLGEVSPPALRQAEAIVLLRERTRVDAALLGRLPSLRLVSLTGPTPHVDLEACTRRGVVVSSGAGVQGDPRAVPPASRATAELTWGLVLASARHLVPEARALREGRWQAAPVGTSLYGRVLGILGYGQIGALVAGYGKVFGMRVLAWGGDGSQARARADGVEVAANREVLFSEADVLCLHLRLSARTRGAVSAADLARMKPDALFVNTSRAELVAPGALLTALRAGRPGAAALDVFEREPVVDGSDPLLALDNVLCTPHLGYVERQALEQFYARAFDQVLAFEAGAPVDVRNPQALQASVSP